MNRSFRPDIKCHTECPSVYHTAIDASSACRKSKVCKTLNMSKFTRSCIPVVHRPPHMGMKLTALLVVEEMTFTHKLMVAFGEISLMHHFHVLSLHSESPPAFASSSISLNSLRNKFSHRPPNESFSFPHIFLLCRQ